MPRSDLGTLPHHLDVVGSLAELANGDAGDTAELDVARLHQTALTGAGCSDAESRRLAAIALTATAVGRVAGGDSRIALARPLLRAAAELSGLSAPATTAAVGQLALRDPERARLPPRRAVRAQLRLLALLAPLQAVSLWTRGTDDRPRCLESHGGQPSDGWREIASRTLACGQGGRTIDHQAAVAVAIGERGSPTAALVARPVPGRAGEVRPLLREAAPLLACVLDRAALLDSRHRDGARAAESTERRLTRIGLDLHDGPAQQVAALVADLKLFARQLASALRDDRRTELLTGRIADLEARALEINAEIRELARTAQKPDSLHGSIVAALREEARGFARATDVEPDLRLEGPLDELAPSQRIALLRGIQEALRNVREHARARSVWIRVVALPDRIEAEVRDDGRGFHPSRMRAAAVRDGRMGLTGIAERARLIGGRCRVRSRPGGPTSVLIYLPRRSPDGDATTRMSR